MTSGDKRLSMLPRKALSYLAVGAAAMYLLICPLLGLSSWLALIPFFAIATKGVDISIQNGLLLSVLWISYILVLVSPFYLLIGRYTLLSVYIPIIGVVFYKEPHEKATWIFLLLEYVFWDVPLLMWIRVMSRLRRRALKVCYFHVDFLVVISHPFSKPFYSPVTDSLAVGSIPLTVDVAYLRLQNVSIVVNMCLEYSGPVEEYAKSSIKQIRLPTPDVCEPKFEDLIRGIREVRAISKTSEKPPKIFVHCKAGRGRAATFALCYLISTGMSCTEAMELLKSKRQVIEPYVANFKVVEQFIHVLSLYLNDVDLMLKELPY